MSIEVDPLHDLADEYVSKMEEQRADDLAHTEYRERTKERRALLKELKASIRDLMATQERTTYHVGAHLFTLDTGPKVKVNLKRVREHLGEDAFRAYSQQNQEHEEHVRIKKQKQTQS
jgi:hypothetical protein